MRSHQHPTTEHYRTYSASGFVLGRPARIADMEEAVAELQKRARRIVYERSQRHCGYCKEVGHDRRVCPSRPRIRSTWIGAR